MHCFHHDTTRRSKSRPPPPFLLLSFLGNKDSGKCKVDNQPDATHHDGEDPPETATTTTTVMTKGRAAGILENGGGKMSTFFICYFRGSSARDIGAVPWVSEPEPAGWRWCCGC